MAMLLELTTATLGVPFVAQTHLIVYATKQLKARNINSREFVKIAVINLSGIGHFPADLTTAYTERFGNLISGYIIQFRFVCISAKGLASNPYEVTVSVA